MSLIIHEFSTDQNEKYNAPQTISLKPKMSHHLLTMCATVEESKDIPTLQQFIDSFIGNHTTLLPNYSAIKFPCGRQLSFVIYTGDGVFINFFDVDAGGSGFTHQYKLPISKRRDLGWNGRLSLAWKGWIRRFLPRRRYDTIVFSDHEGSP